MALKFVPPDLRPSNNCSVPPIAGLREGMPDYVSTSSVNESETASL